MTRRARWRAYGVWLALLIAIPAAPARPQSSAPTEPVTDLLRKAADTLDRFIHDAAGVVYEENYGQYVRVRQLQSRQLKSDLLILADPAYGWIESRDVFEVDGRRVRDRDDRLMKLFAQPNADPLEQAQRIIAEGARFNVDDENFRLTRTLNLPMIGLTFLQRDNQARSTYSRDGTATINDTLVVELNWREIAQPRLIGTPDNAAARGTVWLTPDTGQVVRSALTLTSSNGFGQVTAEITVDFAPDAKLRLWLPRRMRETYRSRAGEITGEATYSKYRRFDVSVEDGMRK